MSSVLACKHLPRTARPSGKAITLITTLFVAVWQSSTRIWFGNRAVAVKDPPLVSAAALVQGPLATIKTRNFGVSKVRSILVALICASPAILLWDGLIMQGIVSGIAAIVLSITAVAVRPGETKFLISTVRPFIAVAAIPALWILVQVLPIGAFPNPIWASTAVALGRPVSGSISIDPGASIISLGQYLSMIAMLFVTAAVAADRQRAEWLLFALAGACAATALMLVIRRGSHPGASITLAAAQALNCAAMGAVIASGACIRTIERYQTRHKNHNRSAPVLFATFAASCIAFAICVAALLLEGTHDALFATGCGVTAVVSVFVIRRFGLGGWGAWTIVAVSIGVSVTLAATQLPAHDGSLLAFATSSTGPAESILADAPLVGTGAGTFGSLVPIYSEIDNPSPASAPSTAAALAIELGKPMLCLLAVATTVTVIALLRGSLHRRRDSFYPAMAGGCLLTLALLAFVNAGLLGTASSMIAAAVLGVGIIQSKSRSVRAPN
jgi:hypothetical protein